MTNQDTYTRDQMQHDLRKGYGIAERDSRFTDAVSKLGVTEDEMITFALSKMIEDSIVRR